MNGLQLQPNDYVRHGCHCLRVLGISAPKEEGWRYLTLRDTDGNLWEDVREDQIRPIDLDKRVRQALNITEQRFIHLHQHQQWLRLVDDFFSPDTEGPDEAERDDERDIMLTIERAISLKTYQTALIL